MEHEVAKMPKRVKHKEREGSRRGVTLRDLHASTAGASFASCLRVPNSPTGDRVGAAAFVFLLAALVTALFAVLPGTYRYRAASISDRKKAYDALLARKARSLTAATILFGLGLAVFAAMPLTMLFYRL